MVPPNLNPEKTIFKNLVLLQPASNQSHHSKKDVPCNGLDCQKLGPCAACIAEKGRRVCMMELNVNNCGQV